MTESLQGAAGRRKVIVIDDERIIATTLAIILTNSGFEARAAFSGEEALDLIQGFPPTWSLQM